MDKEKIKALCVSPAITLKEAMQKLNDTAEKILFAVNEHQHLEGTLTDGDIRRGLIKGLKFSDEVEKVIRRQYSYIADSEPDREARAQRVMLQKKIEQIPVLNGEKAIVDVILWTELFGRKGQIAPKPAYTNPVVIMAGGKGTRLDPFTKILPKPLIPIGEKPIIEIIMEKFYNKGFENFILTLNYKKEYIKMFVRENDFPYAIDWVEENDFGGTAGSLALLAEKITETFIVSNCDIILDADYANILQWHREHHNLITLVGCHKEIKVPYGILELDNGILKSFVEKPHYDVIINTGVYVMEPDVISFIPKAGHMDMNLLIEAIAQKGKVSVYPVGSGWFDIGQWEEYTKTLKNIQGGM
jgi:dTDP-glucose pyrophosphorylase